MTILSWSTILASIAVTFILVYLTRKKKKFLTNYDKPIEYTYTFILTFSSIFLGIFLNDIHNDSQDRLQIVKLLNASKDDIDASINDIKYTMAYLDKGIVKKPEFVRTNTYDVPKTLGIVLQKDFIARKMNAKSFNYLLNREKNVTVTLPKLMIEFAYNENSHSVYYNAAIFNLINTKKIIDAEIDFQNGDINEDELSDKIDEIEFERKSTGTQYIPANNSNFNIGNSTRVILKESHFDNDKSKRSATDTAAALLRQILIERGDIKE